MSVFDAAVAVIVVRTDYFSLVAVLLGDFGTKNENTSWIYRIRSERDIR